MNPFAPLLAGLLVAGGPDAAPVRTPTPAPRDAAAPSMPVVSKAGTPTPAPPTARQKALSDIAHSFDEMEKTIEKTYAKLIDEAKRKRENLQDRVHVLEAKIAVAKAEGKPAKEIASMEAQDVDLQKQLRDVDHEIDRLQKERQKALDDLRLKKQKALDDAKKALPTPAPPN
jgi:predicted RNase H-like nuclease (RuvC/YqgF family)